MENTQYKAAVIELKTDHVSTSLLAFCKATAEQMRLDILQVLSRDSFGVLELCRIFDCKQSGISHHLKILANAGLVLRRREGNSIFYRRAHIINNSEFSELQKELFKAIEQQSLSTETEQRLMLINTERAENAQAFFQQNADKFSKHQEQVVAYELYALNAKDLIESSLLSVTNTSVTNTSVTNNNNSVLEVGPGEGEFLAELSKRFSEVIALDYSAEMLTKAKQFAANHRLSNIEFIEGDTKSTALNNRKFDCVVMNMVLHHVPSPAEVLIDIAKVLNSGGQLFITELCSHDQSWVKASCGDLWLGFDPEDLGDWSKSAGFKEGESVYLAQRNGFRVQIRQFFKI